MKTGILIIALTQSLLTFVLPASAQHINDSLFAMKDYYASASTGANDESGIYVSTDECVNTAGAPSVNESSECGAQGIIYQMTQQVKTDLESERVRAVSSDQATKTKKQVGTTSKKHNAVR